MLAAYFFVGCVDKLGQFVDKVHIMWITLPLNLHNLQQQQMQADAKTSCSCCGKGVEKTWIPLG